MKNTGISLCMSTNTSIRRPVDHQFSKDKARDQAESIYFILQQSMILILVSIFSGKFPLSTKKMIRLLKLTRLQPSNNGPIFYNPQCRTT